MSHTRDNANSADVGKVVQFPCTYQYTIEGVEDGRWVVRPHRGTLDTIPEGMCWKGRRVIGMSAPTSSPRGNAAA